MTILKKNQEGLRKDTYGNVLKIRESQLSNGKYTFRWSEKKERKQIYANSLLELRQKEYEIFHDIEMVKSGDMTTLNDFYDLWIITKYFLKDRTFYNYQSTYEKHIQGTLGLEDITTITRSRIQKLYSELASPSYGNVKSEDGRMAQSSIENINQILYQIFDFAKYEGAIILNPCEKAVKKMGGRSKGRKARKVSRLTTEEEQALAEYLETSKYSKKWRPILAVLTDTGLRVGELSALRWESVDFKNNVIHINSSLVYGKTKEGYCDYMLGPPKSEASNRTIIMTDNVKTILSEMKVEAEKKRLKSSVSVAGFTDFVFLNKNKRPYHSRLVNLGIVRILEDYNANADREDFVPIKKFTCHSLRHTFASKFYAKTKDWKALQLVLGDSTLEVCMSTYVEFEEEDYLQTFSDYRENIKTYI